MESPGWHNCAQRLTSSLSARHTWSAIQSLFDSQTQPEDVAFPPFGQGNTSQLRLLTSQYRPGGQSVSEPQPGIHTFSVGSHFSLMEQSLCTLQGVFPSPHPHPTLIPIQQHKTTKSIHRFILFPLKRLATIQQPITFYHGKKPTETQPPFRTRSNPL
jgi:hypothetical protein